MFLLTVIKSAEFITLISGLAIAYFIYRLHNSSHAIRKRTKEEAIQKLELDSIIGIIDGTKELKLAVTEVDYHIKLLDERAIKATYSDSVNKAYEALYKTQEIYIISSKKIENFIFLLERDMIINDKNRIVEEEIENIKNTNIKMEKAVMNEELKAVKDIGWQGSLFETVQEFLNANSYEEINESIERILKVYKAKLDKKEEGWFMKFFKFVFRKKEIELGIILI